MLLQVKEEHRSLVIEKRGAPTAVLLSIGDYVRLATPEAEVLKLIGEASQTRTGFCSTYRRAAQRCGLSIELDQKRFCQRGPERRRRELEYYA